jgi:2-succinyl-5-enolpyruvyl-6-hydroxy-3-cyclohexene-1-carboxylate synthase
VVRFGEMPTCKPLRQWLEAVGGARQIVVDPTHGWNEPSRRAATIVRAAPPTLAAELAVRLDEADSRGAVTEPSWSASWLAAATAATGAIDRQLEAIDGPTEPHVHRALGGLYADGDLVFTASSMPIRDQEAFLPTGPAEVRFLCNRGANGIDGLLSSGLGAAAATRRPTWIVTGDLGLFHDMNGLASIAAAPGPLRIVVLNNGGGGIFEFLPQAEQLERDEFEALFATPVPIALERVAALHELAHERIDRLDRLAAPPDDERVLIEIPIDRRDNVEIHRRIAAAAVGEVERALNRSKEEAR